MKALKVLVFFVLTIIIATTSVVAATEQLNVRSDINQGMRFVAQDDILQYTEPPADVGLVWYTEADNSVFFNPNLGFTGMVELEISFSKDDFLIISIYVGIPPPTADFITYDPAVEFIIENGGQCGVRECGAKGDDPEPIFDDGFESGDCSRWSYVSPSERDIDERMHDWAIDFNQLLISREIGGEYILMLYDWELNSFTYLTIDFHRDNGAVGGGAIDSFQKLYDKAVLIARSTIPYKFEDPDGDGSLNIADLDPFDPDIQ